MATAIGAVREVRVTWRVAGSGMRRRNTVQLIEGYTTEENIPRILAIGVLRDEKAAHNVVICDLAEVAK